MSEHDPQHSTARWLVFCLCTVGLLLLAGIIGLKYAEQSQIARFKTVAPSMTSAELYLAFGKPDRTWGSGILRYEYDIVGGGTVIITFYGLRPSLVTYDGEVLFERQYPTPVSPYTHSIPTKPIPPSAVGLRTLQSKPPPKKTIPEP